MRNMLIRLSSLVLSSLENCAHLAASRVLLDGLASEGNSALASCCSSCGGLGLHSGLDLTGHGKEGLFNIARGFGGCFEKLNAKAVGELLSLLGGDHTLSSQIGFVTNQQLVHILRSISVNFVQPLLYIVEGLVVRNVIDDDNAMGTKVVR